MSKDFHFLTKIILWNRNETSHLNSSLKYPDLTEAKDLDTLEYSLNKEDLSIMRLEQESQRILGENYQSKEKTLDKYFVKSAKTDKHSRKHTKNQASVFTLSNVEVTKSKGEKTTHDSSVLHSRKCKWYPLP